MTVNTLVSHCLNAHPGQQGNAGRRPAEEGRREEVIIMEDCCDETQCCDTGCC
jgi:hypothetical protein